MSDRQISVPTIPVGDMERMATAISASGLFGIRDKNQALALMIVAQAEGRHPGKVAVDYHIIQGKAALKADTMLARFQEAGGKVEWHSLSDELADASFTHPSSGTVRIDWSMDRARKANLTGKDTWRQYPRAMLRSRVISEGIRTALPGVLSGLYEVSEVRDMAADANMAAEDERREQQSRANAGTQPLVGVEVLPPTSVLAGWRTVHIHFGKNRGMRLDELNAQQIAWYEKDWLPGKEANGSSHLEDLSLIKGLKAWRAERDADKADAQPKPEDESQDPVDLMQEIEAKMQANNVTPTEITEHLRQPARRGAKPILSDDAEVPELPDQAKTKVLEHWDVHLSAILAARKSRHAAEVLHNTPPS